MNETRFTSSIRQALDESAERLPLRVSHRLEQARKAALARAPERAAAQAPAGSPASRPFVGLATAGAGRPLPGGAVPGGWAMSKRDADACDRAPCMAWRLAAIVLPVAALVAGLIAFAELDAQRDADEVAELEAAVLSDDVPIAAYADRGFGVYLKNSKLADE